MVRQPTTSRTLTFAQTALSCGHDGSAQRPESSMGFGISQKLLYILGDMQETKGW